MSDNPYAQFDDSNTNVSTSPITATLVGAGRGATMGLVKYLAGAAIIGTRAVTGGAPITWQQALDQAKSTYDSLETEHPIASTIGQVAGSIAGPGQAIAKGVGTAVKLGSTAAIAPRIVAPVAGTIAATAGNAVQGGTQAFSENRDVGTGAAIGAAVGAGSQVVGSAIGSAAKKGREALSSWANNSFPEYWQRASEAFNKTLNPTRATMSSAGMNPNKVSVLDTKSISERIGKETDPAKIRSLFTDEEWANLPKGGKYGATLPESSDYLSYEIPGSNKILTHIAATEDPNLYLGPTDIKTLSNYITPTLRDFAATAGTGALAYGTYQTLDKLGVPPIVTDIVTGGIGASGFKRVQKNIMGNTAMRAHSFLPEITPENATSISNTVSKGIIGTTPLLKSSENNPYTQFDEQLTPLVNIGRGGRSAPRPEINPYAQFD
jgi:hypothetical protein